MMKIIKYSLLAICIYLGFLLAYLPANIAVHYAPKLSGQALPKAVSLGVVSGSVWQGEVSRLNVSGLTLEKVRWDLSFWSLFHGAVVIDAKVGSRRSDIQGKGRLSFIDQQLSIDILTLRADVASLAAISPLPYGLKASGRLNLTVKNYVQAQPWCDSLIGDLQLTQGNIASDFGQVPITQANVKLSCDNGSVVALLKPATNSLGIDTKVVIDKSRRLNVQGSILPPANAPKDFTNLLSFTGRPDAQGRYRIAYQQRL